MACRFCFVLEGLFAGKPRSYGHGKFPALAPVGARLAREEILTDTTKTTDKKKPRLN
jgi:hypothetical protein